MRFWKIVAYIFFAIVLLIIAVPATAWFMIHRALPQESGTHAIAELKNEVTVARDSFGIPHIRAQSREALALAQGYVMAQDRLWQMDLLRRVASGRVAEIVGPAALSSDRSFRTLGLAEAADREVSLLPPDERTDLEAFARGVNRFISEDHALPMEFHLLRYSPQPWRPADTLLIVGYMYQTLTSSWRGDLDRLATSARLGKERAAYLYDQTSPYDHFIVGAAPAPRLSTKISAPAPKSAGESRSQVFPTQTSLQTPSAPLATDQSSRLWSLVQSTLADFDDSLRVALGSNNWVVSGSHTAPGKPLLANDPHLSLSTPSIWYIVQLTMPGWNAEGFTLPGVPGVVIGHNDRIAWGFTNNGADVQDLYAETFSEADPHQYRVNGNWTSAEIRREVINVKGRPPETLDVIVTRHGPIVTEQNGMQYALRWTATEPGSLSHSYFGIQFAHNWQEFRESLRDAAGPGQNIVYADVDGHIGFLVAARIPIRKCGAWPPPDSPLPANVPCGAAPLPGDSGDYEWNGYIPFDQLPQVLDPPGGIIATANAAVVGPAYPYYLTASWSTPWRVDRIYNLLSEPDKKFQPADFSVIQNDILDEYDFTFAKALVSAAKIVKPKDDRTAHLLTQLADWDGRMTADSVMPTFAAGAAVLFQRSLFLPYLGNSAPNYSRNEVFVDRVLRERPALWLPPDYHTYDEALVAAADEIVAQLTTALHSADPSQWKWGNRDVVFMPHPLAQNAVLASLLNIGPVGSDGGPNCIKAISFEHGPSMRMVADLYDWDHSLMVITSGESGETGSTHYRDQFPFWFNGHTPAVPFTDSAVHQSVVQTLRLVPTSH